MKRVRWAPIVAVVLGVAVVALLIAYAIRSQQPSEVPTGARPSPRPAGVLPPGDVLDASLYDAESGWVLLQRCSSATCSYFVTSSQARRPWSAPVQVGPTYPAGDGDAPRHVHVLTADGLNGFVYGHIEAFATHDGGRTWKDAGLGPGEVVAITGEGTGWALTRPCAKGVSCPFAVSVSRDGGRTWQAALPLPDGFSPEGVAAFEKGGLLISTFGTGDMLLTGDGGQTWQAIRGNCTAGSNSNYVATSDGTDLWQACSADDGSSLAALYSSHDSGVRWSAASVPQNTAAPIVLAAGPGRAALITSATTPINLTLDGGRTWSAATTRFGYTDLEMWDSAGWAVNGTELWTTADGGRTWAQLATSAATTP